MDNLYNRIGKTVVLFQELELCVHGLLIELLKISWDKGFCLSSEMSFSKLVSALKAISHVGLKPGAVLDDIDKLCSELNSCEGFRNNVIHSYYIKGGSGDKNYAKAKITAKQRKGLDKRIEFINHDDLDKAIKTMENTKIHLMNVVSSLKKHGVVSNEFFK